MEETFKLCVVFYLKWHISNPVTLGNFKSFWSIPSVTSENSVREAKCEYKVLSCDTRPRWNTECHLAVKQALNTPV